MDPSASVSPDQTVSAEPSVEPTAEPSVEPSVEPSEDADCAETESTPTPTPTPTPSETDDAEDGTHGQIVSTVAHCAPKGKDPLLDVEGAPANHGGYVKPAAHGDTLTLPWGEYDLSTQAGADDLCASLDAARDSLDTDAATAKVHGKKDKGERPTKPAKPAKAAKAKGGKHGGDSADGDDDADDAADDTDGDATGDAGE